VGPWEEGEKEKMRRNEIKGKGGLGPRAQKTLIRSWVFGLELLKR